MAVSDSLSDAIETDPIGKTDSEIWNTGAGPAGEQTVSDDLEVINNNTTITDQVEVAESRDGEKRWMLTSKHPWEEAGEIKGLVGITIDITKFQQETEKLRERAERLEQFASFVSHDLRNPINVAKGFLEHAKTSNDTDHLDRVGSALDQMEIVIDDLLAMVLEGEEGKEMVSFRELAEEAWRGSEPSTPTFANELPTDLEINASKGQLHQLLNNLFRNAAQHAGPDATVVIGALSGGFYVEDDGTGIPREMRESIFEFGHSESGTGIGLAIVHKIAHNHEWHINVTESTEGGARFEFQNCLLRKQSFQTVTTGSTIQLESGVNVHGSKPPGEYERDADSITIRGGGIDVYGADDEQYFLHGKTNGPCRIQARLDEFHAVEEYSKAGVMIRADIDGNGPLGFFGMTRDHGSETITSVLPTETIESEQYANESEIPRWYRIDRYPHTLKFSTSIDGKEWTDVKHMAFPAEGDVFIGLAICSHDRDALATGIFSSVTTVELAPTTTVTSEQGY